MFIVVFSNVFWLICIGKRFVIVSIDEMTVKIKREEITNFQNEMYRTHSIHTVNVSLSIVRLSLANETNFNFIHNYHFINCVNDFFIIFLF